MSLVSFYIHGNPENPGSLDIVYFDPKLLRVASLHTLSKPTESTILFLVSSNQQYSVLVGSCVQVSISFAFSPGFGRTVVSSI